MTEEEKQEKAFYLDQNDFLAKYLFNPEIHDEADYSHIDKNLSVTRLGSRWKEPEQARHILRALHVLNNPKYFREMVDYELTGETKEMTMYHYVCPHCGFDTILEDNGPKECCGEQIEPDPITQEFPEYRKVIKRKSIFPRSYHGLKARFYALTTTSMARDGHLIRAATTTRFAKTESVEDKTNVKSNPFSFVKKNKYDQE